MGRPRSLRALTRVTKGEKVEVSLEDEGFEGAWYEATVTDVTPFGRSCNVVYDSLTIDGIEPPQPLTERVHCTNIRPRPTRQPQPGSRFDLYEIIDAYYNDGWWVGVICKVVPPSEGNYDNKYAVCFPSSPEQIEFESSVLRPHFDWDPKASKWLASEELVKKETLFRPEAKVEVSRDVGNSLTAWFPATIVRPVWKGTFFVEHENWRREDGVEFLLEIVDSQSIRPCPPFVSEPPDFEHLNEVEAFYEQGWWPGVVSNSLAGPIWSVVVFTPEAKEMEFGHSDLRFRQAWISGRWVLKTKDKSNKSLKLDGTKSVGNKRRRSYANLAGKVSAPIFVTTSSASGSADETPEMLLNEGEIRSLARGHGQTDSPLPCKMSKKREMIGDDILLRDCFTTVRGRKTPSVIAMQVTNDSDSCIPSLEGEEHHSNSTSKRSGSELLGIARDIPSNPSLGLLDDKSPVHAKCSQEPLENSTPFGMIEPSILGGDNVTLEDKGCEHQLEAANISSVGLETHNINDLSPTAEQGQINVVQCSNENSTQRKKKVATKFSRHTKRRDVHGAGVEKQRGSEERVIPLKAGTIDNKTSSEGDDSFGIQPSSMGDKATSTAAELDGLIEEIEKSVTGDADHAHCFNGQQDANEGDERSNESLERINKGETSIEKMEAQDLSNVVISCATNFEDSSEAVSQLNGTAREKCNELLRLPSGVVPSSLVKKENVSPSKKIISTLFEKSSPVWEAIESMEVFQSLPQKPHYRPLERYSEELREGTAIGLMGTFGILMENTNKLQISDPEIAFEEKLKTCIHLEEHGFDVGSIRARIEELRRMKHKQISEKRAVLAGQILEKQSLKQRLDEELTEVQEALAELQKRRASIEMEKEGIDSQIIKLQIDLKSVEEEYHFAEHDFGRKLASEL